MLEIKTYLNFTYIIYSIVPAVKQLTYTTKWRYDTIQSYCVSDSQSPLLFRYCQPHPLLLFVLVKSLSNVFQLASKASFSDRFPAVC